MQSRIVTIISSAVLVVAVLGVTPTVQAGTLGCLVGAGAGGFGGSKIGKGNGQLVATALGALLGCAGGSRVQDVDNGTYNAPQQAQPQYQPRYQTQAPMYQPTRPRRHWNAPRNTVVRQGRPQQQTQNYCPYQREYQTTVTIGGKTVSAYGNACSYDGGQTWTFSPPNARN